MIDADNFFNNDDIMTSLLKKLSTSIKIGVTTAMESVWSVSKLSTESVGSRRELVANCVHTADAVFCACVLNFVNIGPQTAKNKTGVSTDLSRSRCVGHVS